MAAAVSRREIVKMHKQISRWFCSTALALTTLATLLLLPLPTLASSGTPPSQVIYRFDDHRWLELKGWACEGELWYQDSKQKIRTEVWPQAFRISFFTYIHPSDRYIAIPYDDLTALRVSTDGGRTFHDARIAVGFSSRYEGQGPQPEDVSRFVVANDRGFLETKTGRVLESSMPFGKRWGLDYIDRVMPGDPAPLTLYDEPNFKDMQPVPDVKAYKGWTHMRCDPAVGTESGK